MYKDAGTKVRVAPVTTNKLTSTPITCAFAKAKEWTVPSLSCPPYKLLVLLHPLQVFITGQQRLKLMFCCCFIVIGTYQGKSLCLYLGGPFQVVASLTVNYGDTLETVDGNYLPVIASDIVTINIYDRNDTKISINCKVNFPVIKDVTTENNPNVNLIPACHYKHDINDLALWKTDGCVTNYNDYMISGVTCTCTHMTSFVILMKPEQIACSILAGCLHYSMLATFSWMLIMSTDIYMKIKHPFADHERRFSYSRYIGWIGPATIVGTTVCLTRQNYASEKCWLESGSGAIWAFVSPVCLTLLIVLVQLVVIGYIAFKKSQLPNQTGQEMENLKRIRTLFSGILLLTPTVGISWIFGVVVVFCEWEVLKYMHVIFNSMQGFFIWLSQCAFSKEVREALLKKFSNQISQGSTTMELRNSSMQSGF
ncbi:adhesion G protein-coupled receptor L2-like [Anneissia japonica]|uniref:adhesion G protein-coupled receptor L2-like n=1 Tax=Anneissia japonica TaxID=1529436 RepID=UPI001425510F|nr:adhesion G protein-coupled receptor L2-like [Anneissia japonica]